MDDSLRYAIEKAIEYFKKERDGLDKEYFELGDRMNGILIEQTDLDKVIGILKLELLNATDKKNKRA